MKPSTSILIAATISIAALVTPPQVKSQEEQNPTDNLPRYTITDLGTLGGTFSVAGGVSNRGVVAGFSNVSGDQPFGNLTEHAFLWRAGAKTNLGTLGGPQSIIGFNNPINDRGAATGASNISTPDPNGGDFCGIGSTFICLPFVWKKGVMTALPLLGGNNGLAGAINNRGQIVGTAETTIPDPTCAFTFLRNEAVIWENGRVQELPPLPGDAIGNAIANNDKGEVVGATGCVNGNVHAVLWQNGTPINLGNLGSEAFNLAFAINNRGQIVGQSTLPDNTSHAFLWQDGVMNDLGSLPDLPISLANGINNNGQVVGISFSGDDSTAVAFVWQDGMMTDLNTLISADSPWFLLEALGINDRCEIAGFMFNELTGEIHGFLATPIPGNDSVALAEPGRVADGLRPVLAPSVREVLRRRLSGRDRPLHGWPTMH